MVAEHLGRIGTLSAARASPGSVWSSAPGSLGEFAEDPDRLADPKARKNCAETSPITRASSTRTVVLAPACAARK
jgi:hypothetical protein